MSNTLITPSIVLKKAVVQWNVAAKFLGTINKQFDAFGQGQGNKLTIKRPNHFNFTESLTIDKQGVVEDSIQLTVATPAQVAMNMTDADLSTNIQDLNDQFIVPAVNTLVAGIESRVLAARINDVYLTVGTPGTPQTTPAAFQAARAIMSNINCPTAQRYCQLSPEQQAAIVIGNAGLFNPATAVSTGYAEGTLGHVAGMDMFENTYLPTVTSGSRTADAYAIASVGANGAVTLSSAVGEDGATINVGEILTVAGVYAVNPTTKAVSSRLQQFVVTEGSTADPYGVVSITISPAPIASGAKQNVSKALGVGAVTFSTAADAVTTYNLAYHKDAFVFVTGKLQTPKSAEFAGTETHDGLSISIWRGADISEREFPTRLDVKYGSATMSDIYVPAVRISQ